LLEFSVVERFMADSDLQMWRVIAEPEQVLEAMRQAAGSQPATADFASLGT